MANQTTDRATPATARPAPATSRQRRLAMGAIAGQSLFIAGWLALGALEGHGYSPGAHDVSDLGAMSAHHALPMLVVSGLSGATTIAFALGALRPALRVADRRGPLGAWLLALSLPALDNFTDAFFRVDCRAADAGCSTSDAFSSWHGQAHVASFVLALLATVPTPFVLASRMAMLDAWHDLARPTRRFGVVLVAGLILTVATSGTAIQGWTQRLVIVVACGGVIALATATARRSRAVIA